MLDESRKQAEQRKVRSVPEGYATVNPWIVSKNTGQLLEFLKKAFDAKEIARVYNPNGAIGHAEAKIGDSIVLLFDRPEGWPPTPCLIRLYLENGDDFYGRALASGATSVTKMTEMSWGDRIGRIRDPLGNVWWIQTHIEDVAPEEMERRGKEKKYIDAMEYLQSSFDGSFLVQ